MGHMLWQKHTKTRPDPPERQWLATTNNWESDSSLEGAELFDQTFSSIGRVASGRWMGRTVLLYLFDLLAEKSQTEYPTFLLWTIYNLYCESSDELCVEARKKQTRQTNSSASLHNLPIGIPHLVPCPQPTMPLRHQGAIAEKPSWSPAPRRIKELPPASWAPTS